MGSEPLSVLDAVLEHRNRHVRPAQRSEPSRRGGDVVRLGAHEDPIEVVIDALGRIDEGGERSAHNAVGRLHVDARNGASRGEDHVVPGDGQVRRERAADRARSDHGDASHRAELIAPRGGMLRTMLTPCLSCSRLVHGTEAACPFCKRAIAPAASAPIVRRRITRAAAIAAVAAMGVACGGTIAPNGDAGADAAPPDASASDAKADAPPPDAGFIDQIAVPPYGVPPFDGGK